MFANSIIMIKRIDKCKQRNKEAYHDDLKERVKAQKLTKIGCVNGKKLLKKGRSCII